MADFRTLIELFDAIPDEDAAIAHFTAIRWREGAFCPHCGGVKVYTFADKKTHKCAACGARFSIKVGTIFEDSKVPLRKWLAAIWLLTSHKKGVASTTLARDIGVTQKTAWFMLHRLREAAATKSFNGPLGGNGAVVEADETFVGGKEKNKHASKRKGGTQGGAGKPIVFGVVERGGELRTAVIPDRTRATMMAAVAAEVAPGATVVTDEHVGYRGLKTRFTHKTVTHARGEYARDGAHTNTVEGAWSLLKRQIVGIHHFVSAKHLSRYVSEATWRYNRRDSTETGRLDALIEASAGRLTYKRLIA